MDSVNDELTRDFHDTIEAIGIIVKGARSRLNGLKSLAKLLNFVVCNPCKSSPSFTILVPLWFIIISCLQLVCLYARISRRFSADYYRSIAFRKYNFLQLLSEHLTIIP